MTTVSRIRRRGAALALLALPLCLAPLLADDKPKPAATDQVKAIEVARGEALMKADTAAIARMTADEFVEISRLGLLRTKADNLRDVASGALKITSFKQDSVSVQIYGDVAILREITDNAGTFRGFPFAGRLWVTRVFVKRDGRWQAVSMQHTPIP